MVANVIRIANRDLKDNWTISYALTGIVGIGISTATKICKQLKINPNLTAKWVPAEDIARIREVVAEYTIEGDLRTL